MKLKKFATNQNNSDEVYNVLSFHLMLKCIVCRISKRNVLLLLTANVPSAEAVPDKDRENA